jgi:hypothetical protein
MFRKVPSDTQTEDTNVYQLIKASFLEHLRITKIDCEFLCANKYDQERHFIVANGLLANVERDRKKITESIEKVKHEIAYIEENYPDNATRAKQLVIYAKGLTELRFSLFMEIFTGKLRKRWLPMIQKQYPDLLNERSHTSALDPKQP